MKLEGLDHPKTLDFAARLDVSLPTAIGHLELLWAFCAGKSPQGNLGKWPDGAIARACYWMSSPEVFIRALIDAGFVDADPLHRLVVHDWRDHAPGWVRAKLQKGGLSFISTSERTSEPTSDGSSDGTEDESEATSERTTRARVSKPSLAKPSQAKSPATVNGSGHGSNPRAEFERVKAAYPKLAGRQNWIAAQLACEMRIERDDATWDALVAGAERYRLFCDAVGRTGTIHVLAPEKFFSAADQPWAQDWDVPEEPRKNGNGSHAPAAPRRLSTGELIEQAIRAGHSDDEIASMPEFDLIPTLRQDIRDKREEIRRAEH